MIYFSFCREGEAEISQHIGTFRFELQGRFVVLNRQIQEIAILVQDPSHQMEEVRGR